MEGATWLCPCTLYDAWDLYSKAIILAFQFSRWEGDEKGKDEIGRGRLAAKD